MASLLLLVKFNIVKKFCYIKSAFGAGW